MNQNLELIKNKLQIALNKPFYIQNNVLTDDESKNPIEIVENLSEGFDTKNCHYETIEEIEKDIRNLKSDNQDEYYVSLVNLMGYDKRLKGNENDRKELAKRGEYLDVLVNDENWCIRKAVVNGSAEFNRVDLLEKLINDKDYHVRVEVAIIAAELDKEDLLEKLVNDKDYQVRAAVAYRGYGLEKLVNDENSEVRASVARQGYGLEKLINDANYQVREGVARYGYGLNVLLKSIGEGSTYIKNACENWLIRNNCKNIKVYKEKFPDLVYNGEYKYMGK